MKKINKESICIGIIGAGAMGQGILQVSLQGGMTAILLDARENGAKDGCAQVFTRLERQVEKGNLTAEQVAAMRGKVIIATGYDDFKPCQVVIEAVFEDRDLKREIFIALESVVASDCILASNTSSLLIASIASVCQHKQRVAGMHFFNPVPLMKLVEVVRGPETSDKVMDYLAEIGELMGRMPVMVRDAPGFLVNHGGRGYTTEAMRVLHERVATPDQIDAIMRDCCGYPMGPFELADLTGMDVNYPATQVVYNGFDQERRLATSFPHRNLLEAGRLGRKTGQGSYHYDKTGKRIDNHDPDYQPTTAPMKNVVLLEADQLLYDFVASLDVTILDEDDDESPLLAALMGEDCAAFASRLPCDSERLVALDLLCDTTIRATLMTAPGSDPAYRDGVAASIIASGRKVTVVNDSIGFVNQRIQIIIANIACEMAQIGIADPEQIDLAMRYGLNYPQGPLEFVEDIGVEAVYILSQRMHGLSGDDRYRPSGWLRRRAMLGLPIHTKEH